MSKINRTIFLIITVSLFAYFVFLSVDITRRKPKEISPVLPDIFPTTTFPETETTSTIETKDLSIEATTNTLPQQTSTQTEITTTEETTTTFDE